MVIKGDLDLNKKINFDDVLVLYNYVNNITGFTIPNTFTSDINNDKKINFDDVLLLYNYINKIPGFNIEYSDKNYRFSDQLNFSTILNYNFDYIVIGGGGSGCTASYELANNGKKVLSIEAGQLYAPSIEKENNPEFLGFRHNGFQISKVYGGGTYYNARAYRGLSYEYISNEVDLLYENDNTISVDEKNKLKKIFNDSNVYCSNFFSKPWTYDNNIKSSETNLNNIISKMPGWNTPNNNPEEFMKNSGPNTINYKSLVNLNRSINDINKHFYLSSLGITDIPGERTSGTYLLSNNVTNNLQLLPETFTNKIIFDENKKAISIIITKDSKQYNINLNTNTKIILTCGVYQTPILLQSSGYIPKDITTLNIQRLNTTKDSLIDKSMNECGKNYWNNLYLNRLFNNIFNLTMSFGQNIADSKVPYDRLHSSITNTIFNGTKVQFRTDSTLTNGNMNGFFDFEQSTLLDVYGYVKITDEDGNSNMRPNISYEYHSNPDLVTKKCIDTIQVYFFELYYPFLYKYSDFNIDTIFNNFFVRSSGLFETSFLNTIKSELENNISLYETNIWSNNIILFNGFKSRLIELVNQRNDLLDSIHYGGTTSKCIDKNFKVIGLENVYVGDLSVFKQNIIGNTMAAAYQIGYVVAHNLLNTEPKYNQSLNYNLEYYQNWLNNKNNFYLNKYRTELDNGYKIYLNQDISNISQIFYTEWLVDTRYCFNNTESALQLIMGSNSVNEYLVTKKSYKNFELIFDVKFEEPNLNSGIQILSETRPSDIYKSVMAGIQVEIDSNDFGGLWGEKITNSWIYLPGSITNDNIWKLNDYNSYQIKCTENSSNYYEINVTINGTLVTNYLYFYNENDSLQPIKNRIGFQIHSTYTDDQLGKSIFFKNILIKEL